MDTQIQAGEYDCGLYAIANVTALVHGRPLKDILRVQDIFWVKDILWVKEDEIALISMSRKDTFHLFLRGEL